MKRVLRVALYAVFATFVLVLGLVAWLALRKPAQRPASSERIQPTPEMLARGE